MNSCKGSCLFNKLGMVNLRSSLAYIFANRCTQCSTINNSIWYLKWVKNCPCCGNQLRRKSKHRLGREKVTFILNQKHISNDIYIK